MKRTHLLTAVVLVTLFTLSAMIPASAQTPAPPAASATPTVKATPSPGTTAAPQNKTKTIFDFEKELGISADQLKKLKDSVNSFNTDIKDQNEKLKQANKELGDLVNSEASLDKIKEKLTQIGAIELNIRLTNVKLSRSVSEILSKDQMKKWREIQKRERQAK